MSSLDFLARSPSFFSFSALHALPNNCERAGSNRVLTGSLAIWDRGVSIAIVRGNQLHVCRATYCSAGESLARFCVVVNALDISGAGASHGASKPPIEQSCGAANMSSGASAGASHASSCGAANMSSEASAGASAASTGASPAAGSSKKESNSVSPAKRFLSA